MSWEGQCWTRTHGVVPVFSVNNRYFELIINEIYVELLVMWIHRTTDGKHDFNAMPKIGQTVAIETRTNPTGNDMEKQVCRWDTQQTTESKYNRQRSNVPGKWPQPKETRKKRTAAEEKENLPQQTISDRPPKKNKQAWNRLGHRCHKNRPENISGTRKNVSPENTNASINDHLWKQTKNINSANRHSSTYSRFISLGRYF